MHKAHWGRTEFQEWVKALMLQGKLQEEQQYKSGAETPDNLWLHFIPFAQGMLYVGSGEELSDKHLGLVQLLASAFATAYARYEDFNRLEAANRQIEKALEDLKVTQRQLIQSEKMASLGELTAGIAHEIQNPLNFVNNFSEVSKELIEEMKEELAVGNRQSAEAIAVDIAQNLEKINHHGKRADAIVKGMLQHSRSGTGQKEPTDINALCEEYLRLAYHGLKARDKSFNAKFDIELDKSLPEINVMQQEMGRVILNIINNAVYAVSEKQKSTDSTYLPTVSVSTHLTHSGIGIRVSDNGTGVPEAVMEKIFQPFFTTKPTGSGTGLGLSLSYDIVKAHGGEIKMETREGEGTSFLIYLPLEQ
jgi:signal transduction histidine kinase